MNQSERISRIFEARAVSSARDRNLLWGRLFLILNKRGRHMFKINSVRIALAALLFALCFIFATNRAMAQSQASTGQIIGTVKDPQSAPVSGANVKVSN